jgi:DNA-binding transcriptional LysR family regulator
MLSPRDLPLLPVFVAVASAGSFTAAARELGLAKSVVSQHVRTLEARCGVRLMERSTRRLHLTQVGELVLDAASAVLTSVRSLEEVVEGHRAAVTGTLRVTLPLDPSLSAMIAPIAAALLRQHAGL